MSESGVEVSNYLKSVDPTLIQSSEKLFEKLSGQVEILANKTLQARQRKEQTVTNQLRQIHQAVFPAGILQERFISIVYFLNKYGPDFVSYLVKRINWDDFQHHTITIGNE